MHSFWSPIYRSKKYYIILKLIILFFVKFQPLYSSLLFFPTKDVVDEDVEQNKKAPLQRMPSEGTAEEVHEEENDGYNYEEDDFEVRLRLMCRNECECK